MPIYAYRCRECGEKFESFRGIHDSDNEVTCPKCGAKKPTRVLSSVFVRNSAEYRGNFRFPT